MSVADEELNPKIFIEGNIIELSNFQELKVLNTVNGEIPQYEYMNKDPRFYRAGFNP